MDGMMNHSLTHSRMHASKYVVCERWCTQLSVGVCKIYKNENMFMCAL